MRLPGGKPGLDEVSLPLGMVLQALPTELQAKIRQPGMAGATIALSTAQILPQLSRGSVKVPFGILRRAAGYVFSSEEDLDEVLVTLPLSEVLARLDPALIERRGIRKQLEDPQDIAAPFDPARLDQLRMTGAASQPPATTPPPGLVRPPAPAPNPPLRDGSSSISPSSGNTTLSSRSEWAQSTKPMGRPIATPAANLGAAPAAKAPAAGMAPSLPQVPTPIPIAPPVPARPPEALSISVSAPVPAPPETPAATPSAAPAPSQGAEKADVLIVNLGLLADGWPGDIREQLKRLNLTQTGVALPLEHVKKGLKRGQLSFGWKTLCSWMMPVPEIASCADNSVTLDLPLKIIAPLYLARAGKANRAQTQLAVDESIPDLFCGAPVATKNTAQTPKAAAAAEKPAEPASTPAAALPVAVPQEGPQPRPCSPHELVFRATGLEGVAGALVVLREGLPVANRLPKGVDAERLSAFMPQIFNGMMSTTQELRMGQLSDLQFTLNRVSWKIFSLKTSFFAVFSRPEEPLPIDKLAALAAQFENQNSSYGNN